MENFTRLMTMIINFMKQPFTIWGHSFSLWGVLMLGCILSVVFWFISQILSD